jgi:putative ABC transport system permease protein
MQEPPKTAWRVGPRLRPRWNKILADLWSNKVRTLLVVTSVAVGLFAVGMIVTIHGILSADIRAGYAILNPANILIYAAPFDDEIVERVRGLDGVSHANGTRAFDLMVRTGEDEWSRIRVEAGADLEERSINLLSLEQGRWPPDDREIVLERSKLDEVLFVAGANGERMVEIKLPSGKIRRMRVAGVVHDQTLGLGSPGGFFLSPIQGYVTSDTQEWLEQPGGFTRLQVTVSGGSDDEPYLREMANRVSAVVEDEGGMVYNAQVHGSHEHPNAAYVDAISGVLFVLGALVVFLSTFLITNTLQALLGQQAGQIAIMKTVGARSNQVAALYMALIFVYGLLALAVALPLSQQAAFALLEFLTVRINFSVLSYRTVPLAVVLQVFIALLVPQIAGIVPILRGARVKVQDALSGPVAAIDPMRRGWLDRRLANLKGFSRPLLISLRNTFRNKGRLALTLITLTLGGAIFIATLNVRASMEAYVDRVGRYFLADINLTLDGSYRNSAIEAALSEVPGVARSEAWAYGRSELLLESAGPGSALKAADAVQLMAPPADSALIEPILLEGRWLLPGDRNAIVLSERFLSRYPGLNLGDSLKLRVNGRETEWVVVGIFQLVGKSAGFVAYTGYEYLSELIGEPRRAPTFRITASQPDLTRAEQRALGAQIEAVMQRYGFGVVEVTAGRSLVENTSEPLNVLTAFLLIMAVLTALVGSISLMGMMSMNVLDRTREIGVMRAIGASDRAVMNLVIVEGALIGLISWLLAVLVAMPISKLMSDTIHLAVFDARADFTFTPLGPLLWLALVTALSILASVLPARSAARLTIREALAYE